MDQVKLTFNSFFRYFVWHPTSKKLSPRDQKIALVGTALLLVTTWGLGHAICEFFLYDRACFKKDIKNFDCAQKRFHSESEVLARLFRPVHEVDIAALELDQPLDLDERSKRKLRAYSLDLTKDFDRASIRDLEEEELDLIEERFERLQKYFDLPKRLDYLPSKAQLSLLTIEDIVDSLEDSPFPFAIMSVEELQSLPISVLGSLNDRQLAVVRVRSSEVRKKRPSSDPKTLAELLGLPEKKLKKAVFTLSPEVLRCLSDKQVASLHGLKFASHDLDRLKHLYSCRPGYFEVKWQKP